MANDTVRIQFSAAVGALIKGVEDAKSSIESVKESCSKVSEAAAAAGKSLLEAFGVAFSTDKIAEFIAKTAEMGEQIERSSAMLGVSTKSVQELGFIAKMTGGDADGLSLAMERLQVNLQKAQSGAGPAYQALQALGLSAKELSTLPLDQQLNKIADAVSKFADGGNKTAIVMELMGRAGAQMIPVLDQGSAGLDKFRASADNTGAVLSPLALGSLSALERSLVGFKAAVEGVAGALVAELAPALTQMVSGLTQVIGDVNVAIQTHTVWEREIIAITTGARELAQVLANLGTMAKDVFTFKWGAVDENWAKIAADRQAGMDRVAAIQKEGDDKINAIAKQAALDLQKILAGEEKPELKPPPPSSAPPDKSAVSAQMEEFQNQIKLADLAYKQTQEQLSAEVKLHEITYDQETQQLLQALDKRHAAEIAALNAEQQIGGLTTAQYQKIIDERKVIDQKYAADHQKIINQAVEQDTKAWQSVLTPFTSAFDAQLRGLLSGTETWGTAMKRIFQDLVMDAIKWLEKLAIEKAAVGLTSLAGGGPSSLLGSLFGGGSQAASGAALQTGALTLQTGATTLQVAAASLQVAATTMGGAGAPLDLLKLATFDVGSWNVPHDMVAMVHQGEMIAPAGGPANAARSLFSGAGAGSSVMAGGVTHVHNWTAWDGASVQSWLTRGGTDQIARAMAAFGPLHPSTQ